MSELNAEQIKKALVVCWDTTCSDCEFDNNCEGHWQVCENALSLINSYEQKIKELTEENERLHASCTELTQNLHECKADTVRKMQRLIEERLDISADGYSTEEVKNDVFNTIDQIAKEMLESGDG